MAFSKNRTLSRNGNQKEMRKNQRRMALPSRRRFHILFLGFYEKEGKRSFTKKRKGGNEWILNSLGCVERKLFLFGNQKLWKDKIISTLSHTFCFSSFTFCSPPFRLPSKWRKKENAVQNVLLFFSVIFMWKEHWCRMK